MDRPRHEGGCDRCEEQAVGFNDDGEFLCEDCLFEEACTAMVAPEVDDDDDE